jgi:adenylyltransferase/sulfurtransferase
VLTHEEILRYSRHLLIPEIGLEGQKKLKESSALVIGVGGLGSPVALYLAAAGVGHLGLVDYDTVDSSNLQRQVLYGSSSLGERKVQAARARLHDLNPLIEITAIDEPFGSSNALEIAASYDVIVDGTDNFPTRYLSNDTAVLLGKPNVYGSIFRFDGQASFFDGRSGPCYRCIFPSPPPPGSVPTCAEGGVLGVLPAVIGSIQATEALKTLLGIGNSLSGRLLLYNALDLSFESIRLRKNPACPVCGNEPSIRALIDYEAFCGVPGHEQAGGPAEDEISASELATRLHAGHPPALIDVREPHEQEIANLPGARLIPLGELASRLNELESEREIIVFCKSGTRSRRALDILQAAGWRNARHLRGGTNAWGQEVDPSIPQY